MDRPAWSNKFNIRSLLVFTIALWVIYAVLSVFAPVSQGISRYGITITQGNLLRATVLVPSLLIWLAAVFAIVRFRNYRALVTGSKESEGFKNITRGLIMLLLVLIVPAFVSLVASYKPDVVLMQKTTVIIRSYLSVIFYFGAFWFFLQGARSLNGTLEKPDRPTQRSYLAVILTMAILISLYTWAIFHNDFRTVSDNPLIRPTYYLPDWLIVLTILIPYLITWSLGVLAMMELRTFAISVPGVVYRRAFIQFGRGIGVVIGLSILLQLISQSASVFSSASLKLLLLLVYVILLVMAVGYLLLARGARHLTAIEKV